MATANTGFPSAPIVDPATGELTTAWRMFLLAMWARTGSAAGVVSTPGGGASPAALAAETAARSAGDSALGTLASANAAAIGVEATARATHDAALATSIAAEAAARTHADTVEVTARNAAIATERTGRIAVDTALALVRPLVLLVTGAVPVDIVCTANGEPVYVTV